MRKFLMAMSIMVFVFSMAWGCFAQDSISQQKVVVYYFHGTMRCPTCLKLEQYAKEAIEMNFKDALNLGVLEFKVINIENLGNEHYVKEYQLYTKSLVVSVVKDGQEITWKNLPKIWEYVGDKKKFIEYVSNEVSQVLKENK